MEQYEIRTTRGGAGSSRLVVVLQNSFVAVLDTCVVAPLASPDAIPPLPHLRPLLEVDDRRFVIVVERLAAVDRSVLGPVVGSAEHVRDEITRALDLLFTRF